MEGKKSNFWFDDNINKQIKHSSFFCYIQRCHFNIEIFFILFNFRDGKSNFFLYVFLFLFLHTHIATRCYEFFISTSGPLLILFFFATRLTFGGTLNYEEFKKVKTK